MRNCDILEFIQDCRNADVRPFDRTVSILAPLSFVISVSTRLEMRIWIVLSIGLLATLVATCCSYRGSAGNGVLTANEHEVDPRSTELFCDVMSEPSRFQGRTIQLSAIMLGSPRSGSFLYHQDCIETDRFLPYEFATEPEEDLQRLLSPDNPEYREKGVMRAEGKFTGVLIANEPEDENKMGNVTFRISKAADILPATPDTPYPWAGHEK